MTKRITITADDFGRGPEHNLAIETAYEAGSITAASVMVGEHGFDDAVRIAHKFPDLRVGLHVCLSDGTPVCHPGTIPLLVAGSGFPPHESLLFRAALSSAGRSQIRKEIAAQFLRFTETGLALDHVDVHRNSHRHPVIAAMIFHEAARWHVRSVRVPFDPVIARSWRPADPLRYARRTMLRLLARHYGVSGKAYSFGRNWSPEHLIAVLNGLPCCEAELSFHPVFKPDHMFKDDLPTLLHPAVKDALKGLLQW